MTKFAGIEQYKKPNGKIGVRVIFEEETPTQQQFKESTDVNNIIAQYRKTGELPLSNKTGTYADMSEIPDYQVALNTVIQAQHAFDDLPSEIRDRFQYDPNRLIKFLQDSKNDDEAIKLGLKVKKPDPTPTPTKSNNTPEKSPDAPKPASKEGS